MASFFQRLRQEGYPPGATHGAGWENLQFAIARSSPRPCPLLSLLAQTRGPQPSFTPESPPAEERLLESCGRPGSADSSGLGDEIRVLIDRATQAQSQSRLDFMIEASRRAADEAILDQAAVLVDRPTTIDSSKFSSRRPSQTKTYERFFGRRRLGSRGGTARASPITTFATTSNQARRRWRNGYASGGRANQATRASRTFCTTDAKLEVAGNFSLGSGSIQLIEATCGCGPTCQIRFPS